MALALFSALLAPLCGCQAAEGAPLPEGVKFSPPEAKVMSLVPYNAPGIVPDGTLDAQEWFAAAAFTGFTDNTARAYAARQTVGYVCHSDTDLCLAFVSSVPGDSSRELLVVALRPGAETHVFSVNPSGSVGSTRGRDLNRAVRVVSKQTAGQWVCEMTVPFVALGADRPADGAVWKACFGRVFAEPYADTTWQSRTSTDPLVFADNELAELVFRRACPYVKVTSLGQLDQNRLRVVGSVYEKGNGEKRELLVYFPLIFRGRSTDYAKTIYYKAGELTEFSATTWASGTVEEDKIGAANPNRPCDVMRVSVVNGGWDGWRVFETARACVAEQAPVGGSHPPVNLFAVRNLAGGTMVFWLETLGLRPAEEGSLRLRVEVLDNTGGAAAVRDIPGAKRGEYEIELPSSLFSVGRNVFRACLLDTAGREIHRHETAIERPDKTRWEGNRIGESEQAPPPFPPVARSGSTVTVWGRQYTFAGGSILAAVSSAGKPLLAAPVTVVPRTDGKDQRLSFDAWRFPETCATKVVAEGALKAADFDITLRNTLEFDGMMRVDMTLVPRTPAVALDGLILRIPLNSARVRYLNWTRGRAGTVPRGQHWDYGAFPEQGFRGDFRPLLWLGDDDRGLLWFAESMKNWNVADKAGVITVQRDGNVTELLVRLIDRTTQLPGPRTITFGLMASPVRPREAGWRDYEARKVRPTGSYLSYIQSYNPAVVKAEKTRLQGIIDEGRRPLLYSYPSSLATGTDPWLFLGNDWRLFGPVPRTKLVNDLDLMCHGAPGFTDFHVWFEAEAVKISEIPIAGLLYDISWGWDCAQTGHPDCGYQDADGTVLSKYDIFGLREFYRRVYTFYRQNVKDSYFIAHCSGNNIWLPLYSFVDATWTGEQYSNFVRDYTTEVPLDQWRACFTGRQFGPVSLFLPEMRYVRDNTLPTMSCATMVFLHDLSGAIGSWNTELVRPYWDIRRDFGIAADDVVYHPYWDNMGSRFVCADPAILVSGYTRPGKALLVVGNLGDTDRVAALVIDFPALALGVNPDRIRVFDGKEWFDGALADGVVNVRVRSKCPSFVTIN